MNNREIPIQVIIEESKDLENDQIYISGECPKCHQLLDNELESKEEGQQTYKYCFQCGQKLKW